MIRSGTDTDVVDRWKRPAGRAPLSRSSSHSYPTVFDGWGYTHMYETDLTPGAKMKEIAFYAPPEGQSAAFAENYGDMTVHEVATDPDKNLVYVSHYALG